jgi:bifunctional non-homologous end joining protein LigD
MRRPPAKPLASRSRSPKPRATRDRHPARTAGPPAPALDLDALPPATAIISPKLEEAIVALGDRRVKLSNLGKPFWPRLGITKGDLIRYYVDVAAVLLPHITDRAMVMRRYPNGAEGESFFMKRAPTPRPPWIAICSIEHGSGNVIDFPVIQDLPSLLWVVNLGCIDLNQWYARCDDVDRPDYLHFDLDPGSAPFARVLETALIVHERLGQLGMPNHVKTTGSKGMHVYVPIVRGPTQKQVWTVAKEIAFDLAARHPALMTAEYVVAKRPKGRVLLDYNQNAWGRTLASVYSVRPSPFAGVSTPVTWKEVERGVALEDFRIDNVPARVRKLGDLWAPLLADHGRFDLLTFQGGYGRA